MISAMCCSTDVTTPIEFQINKNSKMMAFEYQNMTLKPYLSVRLMCVRWIYVVLKKKIIMTNFKNINAAYISFKSDHIQLWHLDDVCYVCVLQVCMCIANGHLKDSSLQIHKTAAINICGFLFFSCMCAFSVFILNRFFGIQVKKNTNS